MKVPEGFVRELKAEEVKPLLLAVTVGQSGSRRIEWIECHDWQLAGTVLTMMEVKGGRCVVAGFMNDVIIVREVK